MFENAIQLPELQDKVNELNAKAKVDHVLVGGPKGAPIST